MNEAQRQEYLHLMGIEPVYLNRPLATARPSPHYEFPQQVAQPGTPPSMPTDAAQPDPRETARTLLKGSDSPGPAPTRQPASPAVAPPPPTQDPATGADQRVFRLAYYRVSPQLAVIDEYPNQQTAPGAASKALLRAILSALAVDPANMPAEPERFDWPLAESLGGTNDPEIAARKSLAGFIRRRREIDGFQYLLVFSNQLQDLIDREEAQAVGYGLTLTQSLSAMLGHPLLKREVWQDLQVLRQQLAAVADPVK